MANEQNLKPFKKGKSGNANGRPKGSKSKSTILKEWFEAEELVTNPITKQKQRLSQYDIIVLSLIKEARAGNVQAIKEALDRLLGKEKASLDVTSGGKAIPTINIFSRPSHPDDLQTDELEEGETE